MTVKYNVIGFCIIGVLLFAFGCKTTVTSKTPAIPSFLLNFLEKNSQNFSFNFDYSPDGTHVLCVKSSKSRNQESFYSVYDASSGLEVYTNAMIGSGVFWHSDNEIKVVGTSRLEDKVLLLIDINTKESKSVIETKTIKQKY